MVMSCVAGDGDDQAGTDDQRQRCGGSMCSRKQAGKDDRLSEMIQALR